MLKANHSLWAWKTIHMKQFLKMKNSIQTYPWGSHQAIGAILGKPVPTVEPQAELWMGAHPKAPSEVFWQGDWHPLPKVLEDHAEEILGSKGAVQYGAQLPYLFKILAADEPLSIQAHPDKAQARIGFDRENSLQIPLNAPHRNYKDSNHKPECLCALTPFWGVCGFRPNAEILGLMDRYIPSEFDYLLFPLKDRNGSHGLKTFFNQLLTMPKASQSRLVAAATAQAEKETDPSSEARWLQKIFARYPDDIGVLSPLFLNLVQLRPGEAIFLKAGVLHAYLQGTGIELMANSDNVLRGGLTSKHIDVDELMHVLDFNCSPAEVLSPATRGPCQNIFVTPADDFELSTITVKDNASFISERERGAEILLCTEGHTLLTDRESRTEIDLEKGESVLVPADITCYELSGNGVVYKARGPVRA